MKLNRERLIWAIMGYNEKRNSAIIWHPLSWIVAIFEIILILINIIVFSKKEIIMCIETFSRWTVFPYN